MTEQPLTAGKAGRLARIVELVAAQPVTSQGELSALLLADGIAVTQATLSRDLDELRAVKVRPRPAAPRRTGCPRTAAPRRRPPRPAARRPGSCGCWPS